MGNNFDHSTYATLVDQRKVQLYLSISFYFFDISARELTAKFDLLTFRGARAWALCAVDAVAVDWALVAVDAVAVDAGFLLPISLNSPLASLARCSLRVRFFFYICLRPIARSVNFRQTHSTAAKFCSL